MNIEDIKTSEDVVKMMGLEPPKSGKIPIEDCRSVNIFSDDALWRLKQYTDKWKPRDYFGDDAACMALLDWAIGNGMRGFRLLVGCEGQWHSDCFRIDTSTGTDRRAAVVRCICAWHQQRKARGQ